MIYQFKPSACLSVNPQVAGEECERLANSVGLTPKRLLDANRDEEAPLHNAFEWDDSIAAEHYREGQAGKIIRSLIVKPEAEEKPPVRAFISINEESRAYQPISAVITSVDWKQKMLQDAMKELDAFSNKYKVLSELTAVFDAIDGIKTD